MSDHSIQIDSMNEALSALVDGEANPDEVARACLQWREQAEVRARWHGYQLIGDVMRSEDLAHASHGGGFLQTFRARLEQEPVVFAPQAARLLAVPPIVVARKRSWAGPSAIAAGFVLVAGALLSSQFLPIGAPRSAEQSLAEVGRAASSAVGAEIMSVMAPMTAAAPYATTVAVAGGSFSQPEPNESLVMRDRQLDQFLHAHQLSQQTESFAGRGDMIRQVVYTAP